MNILELWSDVDCVDLSVPLSPDYPVSWPGLPHFSKRTLNWFENRVEPDGSVTPSAGAYYDQALAVDEHSGTHIDYPCHIIPPDELRELERQHGPGVPLRNFAGPAAVLDATAWLDKAGPGMSPRVPAAVLDSFERAHGRLRAGDVLLLNTGYVDRYFAQYPEGNRFVLDVVASGQWPGWPVPADDFFEAAARRGVRHIGISSPSMGALDDPLGPHRAGMLRGITFTEMLTGLYRLPARGAFYMAFPLKITDQSGSPVRAVAFKPR